MLKSQRFQSGIDTVEAWFAGRGNKPFSFQRQAWRSYLAGYHGLIHSSTGSGKTLAAFLGPVIAALSEKPSKLQQLENDSDSTAASKVRRKQRKSSQLRVLWLTPLRALAADTEENLTRAAHELGLDWHVEKRTGDTPSSVRQRQKLAYPEVLITTPESCCQMLSHAESKDRFSQLDLVVVDEWHELLGTKRGVQLELALAHIRRLQPAARVWALSATLADTQHALKTLLGAGGIEKSRLIQGDRKFHLDLRILLPERAERFPWAGHVGVAQAKQVAEVVRQTESCLVFTNTRSQTEIWYRALLSELPELAGRMATHHGSLDQKLRWWIEDQLRAGKIKCCVCTSSLDLGVDFTQVDQVIQIGSPKSTSRLLQRAGRSGHSPGKLSRLTFVPTNAMEVLEYVGLRDGIASRQLDSHKAVRQPLDVLIQHCVTIACGQGFQADELLQEVRSTESFRNLSEQQWQWVLDFVERGGRSLQAYPDFRRVTKVDGCYRVTDERIAKTHRMSIGTIVSDAAISVQYLKGTKIGTVEESFVAKMKIGDTFMLAGKLLKLVQVRDTTAYVRRTQGKVNAVPRWLGGRMQLSGQLAQSMRSRLTQASSGRLATREMQWMKPIFQTQEQISYIPAEHELLIETLRNRDGFHIFFYPFEGRLVHEGLAALVGLRLSRFLPVTFSLTMNDYGFLLLAKSFPGWSTSFFQPLFSDENLEQDILGSLNATEMAKRQFREVARVAGLIFQGFPGQKKQMRQVQASSNMFFDVFTQYDPENLLLEQTRLEVLDLQLHLDRLRGALGRMLVSQPVVVELSRPSPFGFGLIVDRLRERVSSESLEARVQRMLQQYES